MKDILQKLKDWSTRKTTLWYAIAGMTIYMLIGTLYTLVTGNYLDSSITVAWFDALKWVVGLGGGITVASIIKEPVKKATNKKDEPKG